MSKVIRSGDIVLDTTYEEGLRIEFGVTEETAGSRDVLLGHTIIPPGNKNQWHHHTCEAAQFIIRGRMRALWVEDGQVKHAELTGGDFLYIHKGEIHTQENASDTEPVELVFCYAGANSKDAANTTFAPDPTG